jgi:hypothetical protein
MLLIFRLLFRRNVPAIIAVSILGGLQFAPQSESILGALLGILCLMLIGWTVLFRFGLLGLAAMTTVSQLIDGMPLTLHPEGWYLGSMLLALLFIAAPAAWGFWYSQGGRPLFRDELLEAPARH